MADFSISESSRYGAAVTLGPAAAYSHHTGRYQLMLSGHGFEASNFLSADDLRELRDWINEALEDDTLTACIEALKPFADLGVGSGPDDEVDAQPYRILRGAIRNARAALANAEAA